jgi:hypothetical protein
MSRVKQGVILAAFLLSGFLPVGRVEAQEGFCTDPVKNACSGLIVSNLTRVSACIVETVSRDYCLETPLTDGSYACRDNKPESNPALEPNYPNCSAAIADQIHYPPLYSAGGCQPIVCGENLPVINVRVFSYRTPLGQCVYETRSGCLPSYTTDSTINSSTCSFGTFQTNITEVIFVGGTDGYLYRCDVLTPETCKANPSNPYCYNTPRETLCCVEGGAPLPCPANRTATCNANGTATLSWDPVAGAADYWLRVDKAPASWYNIGPGEPPVFLPNKKAGVTDATRFTGRSFRHFQAQSALHLLALPYSQNG